MDLCKSCQTEVRKLQQKLHCCSCSANFHRVCISGVSQDLFRQWKKSVDVLETWQCPGCVESKVVKEPPICFIETLKNSTIKQQQSLKLHCTINKCDKTPVWRHNGNLILPCPRVAVISMSFEHELFISDATIDDAGTYTVGFGDVTFSAYVTVKEPLSFKLPLHNVQVDETQNINLHCTVSERDQTPVWRHRGVPVTPGPRIKVVSNGVVHCLSILAATCDSAGTYIVEFGELKSKAVVTVRDAIRFTEPLHDVKLKETHTLRLFCTINKVDQIPVWRRNGNLVNTGSKLKVVSVGTEHELFICDMARSYAGNFSVEFGEVKSSAVVSVENSIKFTEPLHDVKLKETHTLRLFCTINKVDQIPVWRRNGNLVNTGSKLKVVSVGTEHELFICDVACSHAGNFSVEFGEVKSSAVVSVENAIKFTEPLHDVKLKETHTLRLFCRINKVDQIPVWRRNGNLVTTGSKLKVVSVGKVHELSICDVACSHAGNFSVEFGEVKSSAVVSVENAIKFTEPLHDVKLKETHTLRLFCRINKVDQIPVWRRNGNLVTTGSKLKVVSVGKVHELSICDVACSHAGNFSVEFGEVKSSAVVSVEKALSFKLPLLDIQVNETDNINLCCTVSEPDQTPVWRHRSVLITPGPRVKVVSNGVVHCLSIRAATCDDAGMYTVEFGEIRSTAGVTVREPLSFKQPLHNVHLDETQSIKLHCTVSERDQTPVWRHRGAPITPGPRVSFISIGVEHCLCIIAATCDDAGTYIVEFGELKSKADVTVVREPLSFKQPLHNVHLDETQSIKLHCTVSERDQTPVWRHRGAPITPGPRVSVVSIGVEHRLCIIAATCDDAGTYIVEFGELKSKADVTVVREAVKFTKELQDINIFQTHMLKLLCTVNKPGLTPVWRHDSIVVAAGSKVKVVSNDVQHFLFISGVTSDDAGKYSVEFGSVSSTAVVAVEDKFGCCALHGVKSQPEKRVLKEATLKQDPFYKVIGKLIPLQPLVNTKSSVHRRSSSFMLTQLQASLLQSPGKENKPISIQLRLCKNSTTSEQPDDFPDTGIVTINKQWAQLRDTHVIGGKAAPARPVDITKLCKLKSNEFNSVDVTWTKPVAHCISVNLVKKRTADELLDELRESQTVHHSHTVDLVKQKLKVDPDNDIATTSLRASLLCPISKVRLSVPCRGADCTHIQCVDALGMLKMNERKPRWCCDICQSPTPFDSLRVDGLFVEILRKVGKDVCEVVFEDDGSWHAKTADDSIMDLDADVNTTLSDKMDMIDLTEMSDDEDVLPKREKVPLRNNTDILNKLITSINQVTASSCANLDNAHANQSSNQSASQNQSRSNGSRFSSRNDRETSSQSNWSSHQQRNHGNSSIDDFFRPSNHSNCYRNRQNNNHSRNGPYVPRFQNNNNNNDGPRYHGNQNRHDYYSHDYNQSSYDYSSYWNPQVTFTNLRT